MNGVTGYCSFKKCCPAVHIRSSGILELLMYWSGL